MHNPSFKGSKHDPDEAKCRETGEKSVELGDDWYKTPIRGVSG